MSASGETLRRPGPSRTVGMPESPSDCGWPRRLQQIAASSWRTRAALGSFRMAGPANNSCGVTHCDELLSYWPHKRLHLMIWV